MKKLIALMMCAMLLLSGCAAVTPDSPGIGLQWQDYVIVNGDGEVLDLTGLRFSVEAAQSDQAIGVRLDISGGGDQADVIAFVTGQDLCLTFQGPDETRSYAMNIGDGAPALTQVLEGMFASAMPQGAGGADVPELTEEEMEALMANLEQAPELTEEEQAALDEAAAQAQALSELIERCITETQTESDGVTYDVMQAHFAPEDMLTLMDQVDLFTVGSVNFPLGSVLAAGGLSFTLDGTLAYSEDGAEMYLELIPAVITEEGDTYALDLTVDGTGGIGTSDIAVTVTKNDTEQLGAMTVTYGSTVVESADWLPDAIDPDAVDLTGMTSGQMAAALSGGLASFFQQLDVILNSVAEANAG